MVNEKLKMVNEEWWVLNGKSRDYGLNTQGQQSKHLSI